MVKKFNVVKMDKFGKIFLPKMIRSQMKGDQFQAVIVKNELHLKPIKDPRELYGLLPDIKTEELDEVHNDEHELPD